MPRQRGHGPTRQVIYHKASSRHQQPVSRTSERVRYGRIARVDDDQSVLRHRLVRTLLRHHCGLRRASRGSEACYHQGAMNERRSTDYNLQFTEDRLAGLYDVFYPPARRDDFAVYLPMVMSAGAVLSR